MNAGLIALLVLVVMGWSRKPTTPIPPVEPGPGPVVPGVVDWSNTKIAPPDIGIYLGSYEWMSGDIAAVEQAAGIKIGWYHSGWGNWTTGYVNGSPHFDLAKANAAWNAGKVIVVQAYNSLGGPDDEHPTGFTIDKLIAGVYDTDLHRIATEWKTFNKPMWFQTSREPNGHGATYFGGFGPLGDQSTEWAIVNRKAYGQFRVPSGSLYAGIASSTIPDGVLRLKAAQRYMHDFFVRREGIKFLTFDTQGWGVLVAGQTENDALEYPSQHQAYALEVLSRCQDFRNFYPGDAYVDWVSINFYMLDWYRSGWPSLNLGKDYIIPIEDYLADLSRMMNQISSVTSKPVVMTEAGFPDGMNPSSAWAAEKVTRGFNTIIEGYPQIKGVTLWSNLDAWQKPDYFPYDVLIRPGSLQGNALKAVVRGGKVTGRIKFSNGQYHPYWR